MAKSHHPLETLLLTFGFGKSIAHPVAPLKVVKQQQAIFKVVYSVKSLWFGAS